MIASAEGPTNHRHPQRHSTKSRTVGAVQTPLAAIILAGGRSSRMGVDKAMLGLGGRGAIDLLHALASAAGCTDIVVAGGDYGKRFTLDETLHGGPVGGIHAAAATLPRVGRLLILAVDAPTLKLEDLCPLLKAPEPGAAYIGLPLPMVTSMNVSTWHLPANAPLRHFTAAAGLAELPAPPSALARLRGANTPAEFARLSHDAVPEAFNDPQPSVRL
jgi:molybdopterin-guanine dinucleotide biosynthesis protein A